MLIELRSRMSASVCDMAKGLNSRYNPEWITSFFHPRDGDWKRGNSAGVEEV